MNYIFCFKVLKQMHVLQCINKTHQSNLLLYRMNLTCKGRHIQTMLKLESRLKKLSTYITFFPSGFRSFNTGRVITRLSDS